jgi:Undecaprenyl-phosphate galactose phosphotransferase WbaP
VVNLLKAQPALGLKVVMVLDDDPATRSAAGTDDPPAFGTLALAPLVADQYGLTYAIVAMPGVAPGRLHEILRRYAHCFRHFLVIPNIADLGMLWVSTRDLGGVLGIEMSQNLLHTAPRVAKRMMDIILTPIMAVALAPVIAAVAALVRLTSRGPVFYSQPRIGKDRRVFRAWKFRTMVRDADRLLNEYLELCPAGRLEWRAKRKLRDDPRLTPVGHFLRQWSLDELPQLWNVLRGQMSLAGPRPIAADELSRYGEGMELYAKAPPGMTGLWQVSGRNDTTYDERVRLDEYYVRNWSVWMDVWILGRTLRCVITRRGAC